MPTGPSEKRERRYEQIKENAREHGVSDRRAEEVAARTVETDHARRGEAKETPTTSARDRESAPRHGGERAQGGSRGPTKDQLYEEARKRHIEGRSSMNKDELRDALGR
ncbi:plasmid stabilization protein [Streptomyces sp. NPDC005195]|uniref:plasmid stabilization protein n=1 Tax=Streptomyces sp. NPDC005195 TaxID=3154561 RepID=UPI0033BC137A